MGRDSADGAGGALKRLRHRRRAMRAAVGIRLEVGEHERLKLARLEPLVPGGLAARETTEAPTLRNPKRQCVAAPAGPACEPSEIELNV